MNIEELKTYIETTTTDIKMLKELLLRNAAPEKYWQYWHGRQEQLQIIKELLALEDIH
jgi:hypothetical protein